MEIHEKDWQSGVEEVMFQHFYHYYNHSLSVVA